MRIGRTQARESSRSTPPWIFVSSSDLKSTICRLTRVPELSSKMSRPSFESWSFTVSTMGPRRTTTSPFFVETRSLPSPVSTATTCVCARRLALSQRFWKRSDSASRNVASRTKFSMPVATNGATNAARSGRASATLCSMSTFALSASTTRLEIACWIAGSSASGPTVSTYWSVLRSVLWVHTARSDSGARRHTMTTSTPQRIRRHLGTFLAVVSVSVISSPARRRWRAS